MIKKKQSKVRSTHVLVHMTPKEKEAMRQIAESERRSLSELGRVAFEEYFKSLSK